MKKHKKLIIDSHIDTILHSVKEIARYLDQGNIEQARNWLVPIASAAHKVDMLTSNKEVSQ